jgi:hypothetical protein
MVKAIGENLRGKAFRFGVFPAEIVSAQDQLKIGSRSALSLFGYAKLASTRVYDVRLNERVLRTLACL